MPRIKQTVKFAHPILATIMKSKIVGYEITDTYKKGKLVREDTKYRLDSGDVITEDMIIKNKKEEKKAKVELAKMRIRKSKESLIETMEYVYDLMNKIKKAEKEIANEHRN